jgi:hypothetical protein
MARIDFKRRRRRGNRGPQTLGLVVGVRALQMFDAKTHECTYDELPLIERANILSRRPPVVFIEDDGDNPWQ